MKHLIYIFALFVALSVLAGCNKQSEGYRMVYVSEDGSKKVEKIEAANDTDAIRQYMRTLMSLVMSNLDKKKIPYKEIHVISPTGDTISRNKELFSAATGLNDKTMKQIDEIDKKLDETSRTLELNAKMREAIMNNDKRLFDSIQAEKEKLSKDK